MSKEKDQRKQDESLEPVSPYTIMAKLFAHVSKAVVDRFGEEGKEAVREGVRAFGEERGRDIARRALRTESRMTFIIICLIMTWDAAIYSSMRHTIIRWRLNRTLRDALLATNGRRTAWRNTASFIVK